MPDHVEEKDFTLRLVFRTAFAEGYEGDLDGYVWAEEASAISAAAVRAASAAVRAFPGWRIVAGNRGRPAEDEITLEVTRRIEADGSTK
jgi:hypothetical protein